MTTKGKFIVFEGTDGSGKTTQMKLLSEYLESKGQKCYLTSEPTKSAFGMLLRACLRGEVETNEHTIAAMFAADRLDHVQSADQGMLAQLEAGYTVLCDRYYFSSLAYNGGFVSFEWVEELNRPAMELLKPDLIVYLDLDPEEAMQRVSRRSAQERYETLERQKLIRGKYFEVFERYKERENIAVIKSEKEKERTQAHIRAAADALFGF